VGGDSCDELVAGGGDEDVHGVAQGSTTRTGASRSATVHLRLRDWRALLEGRGRRPRTNRLASVSGKGLSGCFSATLRRKAGRPGLPSLRQKKSPPATRTSLPSRKFIGGVPTKPATKRLTGIA